MNLRRAILPFQVVLLAAIAGMLDVSKTHAQFTFDKSQDPNLAGDSLDIMTQMWHALPEAEVGGIALAGGASDASEIPGSMQRLSSKTLRQMSYSDPIRTLHALAGVNLVAEDGFGLRPNVGMRGSGTERSSRITLMEDGVLLAPAPYVETFRKRVEALFAEELAGRDRMKLIGKREMARLNTSSANNERLVKATTNYAYIHPDDAQRIGRSCALCRLHRVFCVEVQAVQIRQHAKHRLARLRGQPVEPGRQQRNIAAKPVDDEARHARALAF